MTDSPTVLAAEATCTGRERAPRSDSDSSAPKTPGTRAEGIPRLEIESIYETHNLFVWRSLLRLGVAESDVPDALQDVFLVVHRRLGEFEQRSSIKTWLFGIAMRVASENARRNPRRREQELDASPIAESRPSPAEHAARSEAVELLYALLQELPEEQRAVFILSELEQMSTTEIAAALGRSVHTIVSRLKVARRRFEQGLSRHRSRDQWRIR